MKKNLALLLASLLLLSLLSGCSVVQKKNDKLTIESIAKHGNITLNSTVEKFQKLGYACGDIINVEINGQTYEMPVGDSFSDVEEGEMLCRFDYDDDEITLAINQGDMATSIALAEIEKIEEDPGYQWTYAEGVKEPVKVYISMKEKEGYLKQYKIRSLHRSNERSDYPDLSDEDFANFRAVSTRFMNDKLIYRSSSPIDDDLGRNEYAAAAMEKVGIKYVVNLHNDKTEMEGYETFADSYYSTCEILNVYCDYDYTGEVFRSAVVETMNFILNADGPVLIHCKEGRDRAAIVSALIEGLLGGSYEDLRQDFIKTYENYYGITPEDEIYELILKENLYKPLCNMLEISDPAQYNLRVEIEEYLTDGGMNMGQVAMLESILSKPIE